MSEFKDMLKYFRTKKHLSQSELAKKIGVSTSTISMYEIGKREPDFETEEAIADLFNTDLNTLRGRGTESESYYLNGTVPLRESGIQGSLRCFPEGEAGGHPVCKRNN